MIDLKVVYIQLNILPIDVLQFHRVETFKTGLGSVDIYSPAG